MKRFLPTLILILISCTSGNTYRTAMPAEFTETPFVNDREELRQHIGELVRLRGTYRKFNLKVFNPEEFAGTSLIYLSDNFPMFIESPASEPGQRPTIERRSLEGKEVLIVGRVFSVLPSAAGGSRFKSGLVEDIRHLSLMEMD